MSRVPGGLVGSLARVAPRLLGIAAVAAVLLLAASRPGFAAPSQPGGALSNGVEAIADLDFWNSLKSAAIRLPLAAALGTALALRPRRRGTPPRTPAVIQTQIVLAIVGAVIMLVVGASLARAFGIVGAANLIRYRSKIDDPKDAVVMLSTLALGLASGVGLYALAMFSTAFLWAALWVIESFEPQKRKAFELAVKLGDRTGDLRPQIEAILRRFRTEYELRGASAEEVSYLVQVPYELHTDRVSNALVRLVPDRNGAVEWRDKGKKDG